MKTLYDFVYCNNKTSSTIKTTASWAKLGKQHGKTSQS